MNGKIEIGTIAFHNAPAVSKTNSTQIIVGLPLESETIRSSEDL